MRRNGGIVLLEWKIYKIITTKKKVSTNNFTISGEKRQNKKKRGENEI